MTSSSSSSILSVLRIGPICDENASATLLKKALLDYFHQQQQKEKEQEKEQQSAAATGEEGRFQVSNRYFCAQILLQDITENNDASYDSQPLLFKEDGIILVFDNDNNPPSHNKHNNEMQRPVTNWDSLDAVHTRQKQRQQAGDLLRLCVGLSSSSNARDDPVYEQEYARRVLWCLDRGYEYLEVDVQAPVDHDARDKEGLARLVEAVAGTVWSSAVMRATQTRKLQQSYQETRETDVASPPEHKEAEDSYVPPDPSLWTPPSATEPGETSVPLKAAEISDEERVEQARASLLEEAQQEEPLSEEKKTDSFVQSSQPQQQEREQERAMDQLEGALQQAASIRELSQSGKLSDQERRQRAGDAAQVLMNLMGFADDSDDDDVDGSNSDNDNEANEEEKEANPVVA